MSWQDRLFGKGDHVEAGNDVTFESSSLSSLDQLREEVLARTTEQRREVVGFWTRLLGSPTDKGVEGLDAIANYYRSQSVRNLPALSDEQITRFSTAFAEALRQQVLQSVQMQHVEYNNTNPTFFENVCKTTVGFEYEFSTNELEEQLRNDAVLKYALKAVNIAHAQRYFPPKTYTTLSLNKATASVAGGPSIQLYPYSQTPQVQ